MKYVPLSAINLYLTLDPQEANNIEELAFQAIERIGINPVYEHTADVLPIENYVVDLPSDLIKIREVSLNLSSLKDFEADDCCSSVDDSTTDCTCCSDDTNYGEYPIGLMDKQVCRIRHQGITYVYDYYALIHSSFYKSNYSLMKLTTNPYAHQFHCKDSPNLYCENSETYEVLPTNQLLTSCEDGNVFIDYFRYATNEHGEYLIPDDPILHEAIANYVMWKHWTERWNRRNEGAERRMIMFRDQFTALVKRYRGNVALKMLSADEIDRIIYHNVKQARSLRVFNNQIWYKSKGI